MWFRWLLHELKHPPRKTKLRAKVDEIIPAYPTPDGMIEVKSTRLIAIVTKYLDPAHYDKTKLIARVAKELGTTEQTVRDLFDDRGIILPKTHDYRRPKN